MNQTTKRILIFSMALIVLLAACAPAAVSAPTQDPAAVQQQIAQAVEMTVAAQNTQAAEQQALIVPSNTPLPTQTAVEPPSPTPVIPTATAFVIVPPTNTAVPASNSGNGSTTVGIYIPATGAFFLKNSSGSMLSFAAQSSIAHIVRKQPCG